jgi:hypothetical protein
MIPPARLALLPSDWDPFDGTEPAPRTYQLLCGCKLCGLNWHGPESPRVLGDVLQVAGSWAVRLPVRWQESKRGSGIWVRSKHPIRHAFLADYLTGNTVVPRDWRTTLIDMRPSSVDGKQPIALRGIGTFGAGLPREVIVQCAAGHRSLVSAAVIGEEVQRLSRQLVS